MTLDQLRQELDRLDGDMVSLMARRQAIAREVAAAKRATGYPTRDYQREREVVLGVRRRAEQLGLSGDLAEKVLRLLIRSSLTTQEQVSVATHGAGSGRRALVIGGAGRMGGWFVQFLVSQGFDVQVADLGGGQPGIARVEDWRKLPDLDAFDFIVVATPLGASDAILSGIAARRPKGVVFDLGSLKSPLRSGLAALTAAGVALNIFVMVALVLVLGIGNVLWADEGFGVRAVEALHEAWVFPPAVRLSAWCKARREPTRSAGENRYGNADRFVLHKRGSRHGLRPR